jgi:hypothetical protein
MKRYQFLKPAFVLTVALALLFSPVARADVLFDNYDGAFLAPPSADWGCEILGPDVPCGYPHRQAIKFTISTGGLYDGFYLNSVKVPLSLRNSWSCLPDPNTTLWVCLYTDAYDEPSVALDSALVTVSSTNPAVVTAAYGGTTVLDDGSTYWVVIIGAGDSNHIWSFPDPPVDTGSRKHLYGTDFLWKSGPGDPAVRVEGVPTGPVPVRTSTWGAIKSLFR